MKTALSSILLQSFCTGSVILQWVHISEAHTFQVVRIADPNSAVWHLCASKEAFLSTTLTSNGDNAAHDRWLTGFHATHDAL
jgi:hypothetical protein